MPIVKVRLDAETWNALIKSAEIEHRPPDMQAEYLIHRAVRASPYADGAETAAVVLQRGKSPGEIAEP